MSDQKRKLAAILPPRIQLYDPDAKTSRAAVGIGILILVAIFGLSWWIRIQ